MDFKDYINELNNLDNQEARTELETFYALNVSIFKFFMAIDSTIQDLLRQPNINIIAKRQLEDILPMLAKLKSEILNVDSITYAKGYKTKVEKAVGYIKNQMVICEVAYNAQNFFELLDNNKAVLLVEQKQAAETEANERKKAEKRLTSFQKAEKIILDQGVCTCDIRMLCKLAWKSKNVQVLEVIAKESGDIDVDENDKVISQTLEDRTEYYEEYYPNHHWSGRSVNSINCFIAGNPKVNGSILKMLANNENISVVAHVAENPNTPKEVIARLATHNNADVRAGVAENPATPNNILLKLAYDKNCDVRCAIARNSNICNISPEILQILSLDKESCVRFGIAMNSSSPQILKTLSKDKDRMVSYAAKKNDNYVKEGCFIATACYGDYDAIEVITLRNYRDEYLLKNWLGTLFVKFYYAMSPSIAKQIEKSDKVKGFIRNRFLRPIVRKIQRKLSNKN